MSMIHLIYIYIYIIYIYIYIYLFNPLNAELNPICHLLALLEAHHIFHVSRIRVNIVHMMRVLFFQLTQCNLQGLLCDLG